MQKWRRIPNVSYSWLLQVRAGGGGVVQHKIETCRLIEMKDTTSSNSDSKN